MKECSVRPQKDILSSGKDILRKAILSNMCGLGSFLSFFFFWKIKWVGKYDASLAQSRVIVQSPGSALPSMGLFNYIPASSSSEMFRG